MYNSLQRPSNYLGNNDIQESNNKDTNLNNFNVMNKNQYHDQVSNESDDEINVSLNSENDDYHSDQIPPQKKLNIMKCKFIVVCVI